MNNRDRILTAIENTKRVIPGYFEKTCLSRTEANAAGSYFAGTSDGQEVETLIKNAYCWTEKKHPAVSEGCFGFCTCDIPSGFYGMTSIADLPDDSILVAKDDKNTGNISMTITKDSLSVEAAKETWIILGLEQGEEVVYTFHPGAPVPRSMVSSQELKAGSRLTKRQALQLGFNLAKITE